jgi:xyloglucan fucosyltransferase
MQQRKAKVVWGGAESAAAQEIPASSQLAMAHNSSWPEGEGAPEHSPVPRKKRLSLDEKRWNTVVNVMLVAFVMAVPPVVVVFAGGGIAPAVWIAAAKAQLRRGELHTSISCRCLFLVVPGYGFSSAPGSGDGPPDRLLGGLLADGLDERTCRSRYESSLYSRRPARRPSPHLIAKLRRHEELQRRCGPNTDAYSRAVQQLRAGKSVGSPECKYVVSISYRGLGNRILAAASAFLYAVLTDRVLLVDPSNDMGELFCEPFPGTTWLLPREFPLASYTNFSIDTAESYGNMLKNRVLRADVPPPPTETQLPAFVYLHLDHDYGDEDKMFFCDDDQRLLSSVQWLVMRTDMYTVPGLFLVAAFQEELDVLFPERDAVFHHLARYLFHPTNRVWGLVTRYYRAYLARAELRLGVQVRNFDPWAQQSPVVLRQITSCLWREKLLPEVLDTEEHAVPAPGGARTTAVLVTSLRSWYYERIKGLYWDQATATGEDVSVHQPSHEGQQQYGKKSHDDRAWAEMYLLSLCDVLVTSGWSTFGYVAQGLGGMTPWVLHKPTNATSPPDPPCFRDVSMEPCFHAPHVYDCKLKRGADTGKMLPHVRNCEDVSWGLKLVDTKLYRS